MNKVAGYLSEHILGEVTTDAREIEGRTRDKGLLEIKPELVVFPRLANDIRKAARFSWQLAEKNHRLPITVRGAGTSTNGASIGRGIVLDVARHMHQVFEYDAKQKLVRLQPGTRLESLQAALRLHGTALAPLQDASPGATLGGLIASNYRGAYAGKYGDVNAIVDQLEVVLTTGDVLQTGRLSKRDLNRKKGLQTFEGEVYRSVDNLIEDHREFLDNLRDNEPENLTGYAGLAQVKQRDGSVDLTPLFIGSEGTLGIVSEMILRAEFMSLNSDVVLLAFAEKTVARDASEDLRKLEPAFADYFEAELFIEATKYGKKFDWLNDEHANGAVIIVGFDNFSDRVRKKKLKKLAKLFDASATVVAASGDNVSTLLAAREVTRTSYSSKTTESWPALFDGFYVPENRFEDFAVALSALGTKHHQDLMLHGHLLSSTYTCRPALHLSRVGDKQKVFKLLSDMSDLIDRHGGYLIGAHGEGRLAAKFARKSMDDEYNEITDAVKAIFDPHNLLNPGVKEDTELKTLVGMLPRSH